MKLTHLDNQNNPKMVDVGNKNSTKRVATASGIITMNQEAYLSILNNNNKKGPVLQTAIIAAIMGTKQTSALIPMCHPLMLSCVNCKIKELKNGFKVKVTTKLNGQTGVEMEALMGVNIALLTIYDMVKAIDKSMVLSKIKLLKKKGGKSGIYKYKKNKSTT